MGLDMYLERNKCYKNTNLKQIYAMQCCFEWEEALAKGKDYTKSYTFEDFFGIPESEVPSADVIEYYRQFYVPDDNHGFSTIVEEVGHWRKANAIHRWFVENVQDGFDDCKSHKVEKEQLEELLNLCKTTLNFFNKGRIDKCSCLLPTQEGFFFGGTDYGEYYKDNLISTIEIIENVLETTDFETETISYCSSW